MKLIWLYEYIALDNNLQFQEKEVRKKGKNITVFLHQNFYGKVTKEVKKWFNSTGNFH